MKSYFNKSLVTFLFYLLLLNNQAFSAWWLTHEDCNTWIYNAYYWNTCDTCWYFNDGVNRLYKWKAQSFWDYYNNIEKVETIFSSTSNISIIDFWNYLNDESILDRWIQSNWVPANLPDNEAIIFTIKDLILNSNPANRDIPVWRIEYLARGASVDPDGETWLSSTEWKYLYWVEAQNTDLTWDLNINWYNSDWAWTKKVYSSSIFEHKECYVLLSSWCWDNNIDSFQWETCDDWNNIDWDGCTSTCSIEIPPVSSSSWGWSSSSSGGWSSSSSSSWGWSSYCWDGNVQRPNSNLEMEECDFWSESDWSFCNTDCTYSNSTFPSSRIWEITIPNGWSLLFGPIDNVIIWEWMNPYIAHSLWKPYLKNYSDYDFYFDQLCVVEKSWNTLLWSTVCENTNRTIKAWETINFPYTPNFIWSPISSWNYADNRLVTTIKHNWVRYDDAYFVWPLDVRVAKPSIATTWGGTSYLANNSDISNISDIANNWELDTTKNKNFVWVWVSWGESSYSNDITDAWSVDTIQWEWEVYSDSLNQVSDISWTAIWSSTVLSDFENYNWISNVFILRNTNFIVNNNIFSSISWARTYVIENWDLQINSDIIFPDNIAFVVKWWNIKINKTVLRIDWTYLAITKDWIWWKFVGIWGNTTNVLLINWSLYWNINDLISSRTYVKQNSNNQIDVWTIVSFGSSLFRKSAPLITTFINEYLQSEKIAK